MNLFGVGASEALLVLVIALIVVGPQRFPEIARQGGRWYRVARRYTNEVMTDVRAAMEDLESEVEEQAEEFRSIREIGDEVSADLRQSRKDLEAEAEATKEAVADVDETESTARRTAASREPTSIRPSKREPATGRRSSTSTRDSDAERSASTSGRTSGERTRATPQRSSAPRKSSTNSRSSSGGRKDTTPSTERERRSGGTET